jgi:hypothetical protein
MGTDSEQVAGSDEAGMARAAEGFAAVEQAADVLASLGGARWSVDSAEWADLPPEVAELLSAPVVVHAWDLHADKSLGLGLNRSEWKGSDRWTGPAGGTDPTAGTDAERPR